MPFCCSGPSWLFGKDGTGSETPSWREVWSFRTNMPKSRFETRICRNLTAFKVTFFLFSTATGRLIQSRCPNKVYVFNRVPKLKFIQDWELGNSVISVFDVKSRQDCQDLCLAQTQFPCRSASFQLSTSQCYLNEVTQESQPWRAQPDQDFDYLENVCLSGETRCSR